MVEGNEPLIPMSAPDIGDREIQAVTDVLRSGILSLGPHLEEFERGMASFIGADHAVGVSSGTSGLHLSLLACGCRPGNFVVTTPFSFIASANAILHAGCIPLFVDVDPLTGNIDPELLRQLKDGVLRDGKIPEDALPPSLRVLPISEREMGSVGAVLPVHVFGQPADMNMVCSTARELDCAVIEDACEAIGSEYRGKKAGNWGHAAVFAFYPNKQMTTAEGGMVVTDDAHIDAVLRSLRNQGRGPDSEWLQHERLGFNYRMSELSAALGTVQLSRLSDLIAARAQVAGWYSERLSDLSDVVVPSISKDTSSMSWFVYVVRFSSPSVQERVRKDLSARRLPSRQYFPVIHLQRHYRDRFGYAPGAFPMAEELADVSLALPFSSVMTESDVDLVCDVMRETLSKAER